MSCCKRGPGSGLSLPVCDHGAWYDEAYGISPERALEINDVAVKILHPCHSQGLNCNIIQYRSTRKNPFNAAAAGATYSQSYRLFTAIIVARK